MQNEDVADHVRTMNNIRRIAMILLAGGAGIVVFELFAAILHMRALLVVPAAGIIAIAIGVGFFIDYKMQAAISRASDWKSTARALPASKTWGATNGTN